MVDIVLVNSNFIVEIFVLIFIGLRINRLQVLYFLLNFLLFDILVLVEEIYKDQILFFVKCVFLLINRYERKKNLNLVLEVLDWFRNIISDIEWKDVYLVMVGKFIQILILYIF